MVRLLLTLLLGGCTCSIEPAPASAPLLPSDAPEAAPLEWIDAVVELDPRPSATRVTVFGQRMEVDNAGLIDTWPPAAVTRARTDPHPEWPEWPRMHAVIDDLTPDERVIGPLVSALRAARQAERASTGLGTGAGVYDLRVASALTFAELERVLYTASQAGYFAPRLVLGDGDTLARLDWPHAAPRSGPTEAELRAAIAAVARDEEPVLPSAEDHFAHLTLTAGRVDMSLPCEADDDPRALAACVRGRSISLSVEGSATMGEVMPWVQHLTRTVEELRVVSR